MNGAPERPQALERDCILSSARGGGFCFEPPAVSAGAHPAPKAREDARLAARGQSARIARAEFRGKAQFGDVTGGARQQRICGRAFHVAVHERNPVGHDRRALPPLQVTSR